MGDVTDSDYPGFQPLAAYRGIDYGPNFAPQNRGRESLAIDGTKSGLRDPRLGSPFTFRVRPPDILLNALAGGGEARTRNAYFDRNLEEVFQDRLNNLMEIEERFANDDATEEELAAARLGVLGGRAPQNTNVSIIESAQRMSSNFSRVRTNRSNFDARSFVATGPTRGASVTQSEPLVAGDGTRIDPQRIDQTNANRLAVSDLNQALSALTQLNKMLATPALTLLVNPESLRIEYAKKQTYSDRNRFNYIFQSWGEEQVRLNVNGRSAGFVVGAVSGADEENTSSGLNPVETAEVSGYQYASKWDSAAWQNLMGLFSFYRNNGYIYDLLGGKSEAHLYIGNIEIAYDQWVYVGNFENFQYSYSEMKQHGAVEFSFDFVVSFMFDRSQAGPVVEWEGGGHNPQTRNTGREGVNAQTRANYTQTVPDGVNGQPSTCILDQQCNPFAPRRAGFGVELDPFDPIPSLDPRFPTGGT